MPNSMVVEVTRRKGETTFHASGWVQPYGPQSRMYVQVFISQAGGAVAVGGGAVTSAKGDFEVTAEPTGGSTFLDDLPLTTVSHATESWPSTLDPVVGGQDPPPPDVAVWRVEDYAEPA